MSPLKSLEYMTKIWRLQLKQQKKTELYPIIPILLYHGKKPWKIGNRFQNLLISFSGDLSKYVADFEFVLIDLGRFTDDRIKGEVISRVTILLFKHVFDPDFKEKLPGIFRLMRELVEAKSGLEFLETVLKYGFSTVEDITETEIKNLVEEVFSLEKGELVMTLAERLRQQGIRESLPEAVELGVSLRFGSEGTRLLIPKVEKIDDNNHLRILKESLKRVETMSDFEKLIGNFSSSRFANPLMLASKFSS